MNSNTGGNLVITAGLSSVQVDATRTLTAEPGTQLVTIALPDGAPTAGDFALNLNFQLPPGTTSLEMKPLLTGQVAVNGQTFYPPLLPCMTDIAAVPTITTPLPVPGDTLLLPSIVGLGCQNATYDFGITAIPTLPQWALILLTLALLTLATWQLAGQLRLASVGTSHTALVLLDRHQWGTSLLLGQGVAGLSLLLYALFVNTLLPHDGVGTVLAGLLIGAMIEGYRRGRSPIN